MLGCAYEVSSSENQSNAEVSPTVQREAPVEPVELDAGRDSGPIDPDACVNPRFAADQIPYGFQYDINCPPIIYAPPRWIPPWDPSPIINAP